MNMKKVWISSVSAGLLVIVVLIVAFVNASAAASVDWLLNAPDIQKSSLNLDQDIVGLKPDQFSPDNNAGEGYVKKAETAHLELYYKESDYLVPNEDATGYVAEGMQKRQDIAVYDKRTKKLWRALVNDSDYIHDNYAQSLTAQFQSLVTFSYIDAKKDKNKPIDANVMDRNTTVIAQTDIPNGLRIHYNIQHLGIQFSVDFKLGEDFLDVSIPDDRISENINNADKINAAKKNVSALVTKMQDHFFTISNGFNNTEDAESMIVKNRIDRISRILLDISGGNISAENGSTKFESLQENMEGLFELISGHEEYKSRVEDLKQMLGSLEEDIVYMTVSQLCGLVQLNVLPYFGAGNEKTEGYVFYPDGSGAISYFNRYHSVAAQNFREDIYTNNVLDIATYLGSISYEDENNHEKRTSVKLPVFGIKNGTDAFVAIVAEGDSDAAITYNPSFTNIKISNAFSSYYMRSTTQNTLSDGTIQNIIDDRRISQARTQRYYFLTQERADYSGMAVAYRDYLEEHKLINKSPVYQADDMPLSLTAFMGLYSEDDTVSYKYVPITKYSDVRKMIETLKEKGVSNMDITFEGWSTAGFYNKRPDYGYKPEPSIGGETGLRKLAEFAAKNNVTLSLETSNVFADKKTIKYADSNSATIKNYGGFTISYYDMFMLNPFAVFNRGLDNCLQIKKYGVDSLTYVHEGWFVYRDYNSKAKVTRNDTKNTYLEYAKRTRDTVGSVSCLNSNIYMAQYADWIKHIPEQGKDYLFADEQVPFYQIVLHGNVPYTGTDYNVMHDSKYQHLKSIEFGCIPSYILTEGSPSIKSSYVDFLFSSNASDWYDKISDTYTRYVSEIGDLWKEKIMQVKAIEDALKCVVYESGAKIYLNYSDHDRVYDNILIKAMDYKVVK